MLFQRSGIAGVRGQSLERPTQALERLRDGQRGDLLRLRALRLARHAKELDRLRDHG
jgi:hypothetical protein